MDTNASLPAKTCETLSTGSEKWSIQTTSQELGLYPDRIDDYTKLVPIAAARAVIEAIEARLSPCVAREAHSYASRLIGFYPSRELNDATTYLAGVTALFAAYPEDFVKRVCDPVTGLPSRNKWLPSPAELKEALEAEKEKRDKILSNAKWTIIETERRERVKVEEAKYKPGTEEQRKAAVARHLATRCWPSEPQYSPTTPDHLQPQVKKRIDISDFPDREPGKLQWNPE